MKRHNLNSDYALINSLGNKDLMIFYIGLKVAVDIEVEINKEIESNAKQKSTN